MRVVALWSVPRARSTAVLRMFVERGDHTVLHEPFSQLTDFGSYDVDGATVRTEAGLIAAIRGLAATRPVFFKDTTDFRYPGLLADPGFLREVTSVFLVRDPRAVIASHAALNPALTSPEVGFERLAEIFDAVADATGAPPLVLSSDDLIAKPEAMVAALCDRLELPYRPDSLSWQPGEIPAWGRTSRWHTGTSASSGFRPSDSTYARTVDNDARLAGFLAHHLPYYERLHARRLQPAAALERTHQ